MFMLRRSLPGRPRGTRSFASSVDIETEKDTDKPFPGLAEMVGAPAVLVITVDLSVVASFDSGLDRVGVISGASIYPFAWNILLAARSFGVAGVLTTYLASSEKECQQLLGVPEHHAIAALIPLGYPVKQLTKLRRKAVEEFTTIDRADGPAFII
jgi:nitroreductase